MKVLIIAVIILLFILVITTHKSSYTSEPLPKTVWLLWFQGWDQAPWIAQQVAETWKQMNPGWEIKMIDRETCPVEIYGDTPQAQSDVVRLGLMAKYGGIWADATLLCMQPLDTWVHEAIEPAGHWMYHGRDECTGPASWFMVAKPGNYMSKKWLEACEDYWKGRTANDNYFWMDSLWKTIHESDQKFREEWAKVPHVCCEDEGQAHMLAEKVGENSPKLKEILRTRPPRAVKLDKVAIDENSVDSNGYYAIKCAQTSSSASALI
jgi:hypothetical protein